MAQQAIESTPLQTQEQLQRRQWRRGTSSSVTAGGEPAAHAPSTRPIKRACQADAAAAGSTNTSPPSSGQPAAAGGGGGEGAPPLSAFEAERAARIAANQARLEALQLPQLASEMAAAAAAAKRKRPPTQRGLGSSRCRAGEPQQPVRRSARRLGLGPEPATAGGIEHEGRGGRVTLAAAVAGAPAASGSSTGEAAAAAAAEPPGPLQFRSSNGDEQTDAAFLALLAAQAAGGAAAGSSRGSIKLKAGSGAGGLATGAGLSRLSLAAADVAKMTKEGVSCCAFHPGTDKLIIAAADKSGKVGLWDIDHQPADGDGDGDDGSGFDGVLVFEPHRDYISSLKFLGPGQLLTGSYDGSVRRLDVATGVWDVVTGLPDDAPQIGWSAGDASPDGTTLFLATSEGGLTLHDSRTNSNSSMVIANRKVNTLHLHFNGRHLASAASDGCVAVWDVRQLAASSSSCSSSSKPRRAQPVCELHHTKSSQGASWAPDGSGRLLSISFDDTLRVWADPAGPAAAGAACASQASSSWKPKLEPMVTIRHNNNTGRWVVPFRPAWSPAADAVLVGDMKRGVALFGGLAAANNSGGGSSNAACVALGLLQAEALTAIPSRLALHPSGLNCLAAATSSGRVHIWR